MARVAEDLQNERTGGKVIRGQMIRLLFPVQPRSLLSFFFFPVRVCARVCALLRVFLDSQVPRFSGRALDQDDVFTRRSSFMEWDGHDSDLTMVFSVALPSISPRRNGTSPQIGPFYYFCFVDSSLLLLLLPPLRLTL